MYHHSEFEDRRNQKSATSTEGIISEKTCTQEHIENVSEAEVSSLSSFSLEIPPGDSLFDFERSSPASEISQCLYDFPDETVKVKRIFPAHFTASGKECQKLDVYKEDTGDHLKEADAIAQINQHFIREDLVEKATHDSDFDYSLKEVSATKINETSETGSKPASWDGKKSFNNTRSLFENDFKEPLAMHLKDRLHDIPKGDSVKHKDSVVENILFKTVANKISKENEFPVKNNGQSAQKDKILMQNDIDMFAGTQKSLLDCIVRACSKEVALFLTQPADTLVRSLMRRYSCPDRVNFSLNKDILNVSDKTTNDIETKIEMQKHLDSRLAEKQQLDHKYKKVVNEVKTLQEEFEKRQDETQNLELCMEMIKKENLELQQQIFRMGNLLHLKSDECTTLTEENEALRRHLNKLLCKVKSYEEIIQCADRRLDVLSSQVSQLEKRNQYLEALNKKPKVKRNDS